MRNLFWLILSSCLLFVACTSNKPLATEEVSQLSPTEIATPTLEVVTLTSPAETLTVIPTKEPLPPTDAATATPAKVPLPATEIPTVVPTEVMVGSLARDYVIALSEDIGSRVAGSAEEAAAAQYIAESLQSFGYSAEVQAFTHAVSDEDEAVSSANVVAIKAGQSEKSIIIGAHYDSVRSGKGAGDNASGVAVMLETAHMLKDIETPYTIYFIAFGAEEVGLVGSDYYVSQMTEEDQANVAVMVNLDSVIAGDNAYIYSGQGTDAELRDWLLEWAAEEELPLQVQLGENSDFPYGTTGDWSDHAPFKNAGMPYIYFESTNWLLGEQDGYTQVALQYGNDGKIWHTKYDDLAYMDGTFPGRVGERLELFVSALYKICSDYTISE